MAKNDLFSTVLRGFHKEQVTQYLSELTRKYEREKEELHKKYEGMDPAQVKDLLQERDRLQKELEEANRKIAGLESSGEAGQQEAEQIGLERLKLLAKQMKSRIEEAKQMEREARQQSERILEAARQEGKTILDKAKEAGSENASMLSRLRERLDQEAALLLAQQDTVKEELEKARTESDSLVCEAQREKEEILALARQQAQSILDKAEEQAKKILVQAQEEKDQQLGQLQDEILRAKQHFGGLSGRVEDLSQELTRFEALLAEQNASPKPKQ